MKPSLALLLIPAIAMLGNARAADTVREITLPAGTEIYQASDLPGYALINAMCLTCHSVEYVKYQPPTSPRAYWQATVVKMQKIFAAPLPDEVSEPIVDYLVKTYGNERPAETKAESHRTMAPAGR
ncbi:MAG TPA: hypothetical protein PLV87_11150 [Opitutaceae bacterium]|nr:hypothetical protein [Opitutaceae bacterium]